MALKLISGLGNHLYKNLLERFETPGRVFEANQADLMTVEGVSQQLARAILAGPPAAAVNAELARMQQAGCQIVPFSNAAYPPLLREIHDPPPFLYAWGRLDNCAYCIALVGSRRATRYGISMAERLASDLAEQGLTVVSGMARGIDTAAHRGAIAAEGQTIAVLGSGLSRLYPPENHGLAERIREYGAVVSEFPMREGPNAYNFPRRNRIISGMSLGTVVIEAAAKSGSLITARLAGEQGREVFAVPGNITSRTSQGTHNLLKQGAKLVTAAEDIIEEFPYLFLKSGENRAKEQSVDRVRELTSDESRVYDILEPYPVHIDELNRQLGMGISQLSAVLVNLELKGLAARSPGMYFSTHGELS